MAARVLSITRRQLWRSTPAAPSFAATRFSSHHHHHQRRHASYTPPPSPPTPAELLYALGTRPPTPISLTDLFDYSSPVARESQVVANANYMRKELPVRFAQRVLQLDALPGNILAAAPEVRSIRDLYARMALELEGEVKMRTVKDVDGFARRLAAIMRRKDAAQVVQTLACGVLVLRRELKARGEWDAQTQARMDRHLDAFHMARIGLRFITEQVRREKGGIGGEGGRGGVKETQRPRRQREQRGREKNRDRGRSDPTLHVFSVECKWHQTYPIALIQITALVLHSSVHHLPRPAATHRPPPVRRRGRHGDGNRRRRRGVLAPAVREPRGGGRGRHIGVR